MTAWYNEIDRQKAATLRNLIEEGAIAAGVVDERSIVEVQPEDLAGFTQCHFFAGGGLWSLCLRNAGWPDDRPVWTGSCPCGPFSKAGLRKGFDDPRHLWPAWFRLIRVCRPDVIFGEQSDDADAWLDLVSSDLEGDRYAIGSAIVPAAGFRGAHERHRIGFVADADNAEWWSERAPWNDGFWPKTGRVKGHGDLGNGGPGGGWLGNAYSHRPAEDGRDFGQVSGLQEAKRQSEHRAAIPGRAGATVCLDDPYASRLSDAELGIVRRAWAGEVGRAAQQPGDPSRPGADWLYCRDSRWRPVEPGTCPLVDASPARMGRLRLYGDAIDVETFTNLIGAYLDCAPVRAAA